MVLARFKVGSREYVIISRRRYDQLIRAERDLKDAEIAGAGREAYLSGKVKAISHERLRRKLGV
jgi:hypothetical protein